MQEGKYRAKLSQYGFLTGQIDQATNMEKPPQFEAQFSFVLPDGATKTMTWYGGFKELQPGKKTSQREITLKTIKLLGYGGTQIAQLAAGVPSGLLNVEKEFEIDLEYDKDQMGAVKVNTDGSPKFRIKWVNDPEQSGFKNQMSVQDAVVKIGGLNLDAEMMALSAGSAPAAPTGYAQAPQMPMQTQMPMQQPAAQNFQTMPPQVPAGPPQQTFQQPQTQMPQQQQMPQQPAQQTFQQPAQQPAQTNQQMGFDANGKPPF